MFSAEDAKEVFQLFAAEGDLNNPLILSSRGDGFVTRKYTRKAFEDLVTKVFVNARVPTFSLSRDLDVSSETVRILAEECEGTVLLRSNDNREIISKSQRDAIEKELEAGVVSGLTSKDAFARKHYISQKSLSHLVEMSKIDIVEVNGYLYSTSYGMTASAAIANLLREHLQKLQVVNLKPTDVPGSPPTWFIHRTVNSLLEDPEFAGKYHIHGLPAGVQCTPVQLIRQTHDNLIDDLRSGKTACIDLDDFQHDNQAIYASLEDAKRHLERTVDVDILGNHAVSNAWILHFSEECSKGLSDDNDMDLGHALKSKVPDSLQTTVLIRVAESIRKLSPGSHRIGDCILTESGYYRYYNALVDLAKSDATLQWQQLKDSPKADIKFSINNIASQIPAEKPLLHDMIKEKVTERSLNEVFSNEILELEKQNEADFADFWVDRIITRAAIYAEGLPAVEDQKLQTQLSELLAQYLQKELVPNTISKATLQGLLLSRKSRKNIQKLEVALSAGSMDLPALIVSLDKFNKKQAIEAPTGPALEACKATMLGDMARRMQKQKKSDGPLLFLTLVVFLFAKHNAGVVYATGKFAPKLLKQLKTVLDAEQYAQLEVWKEAAKAGTLSAEDRDAMKQMIEARV